MKALILADIHSNSAALNACAADAKKRYGKTEQIWVAGDTIDGGPDPTLVIDLLEAAGAKGVMGNHDASVFDNRTQSDLGQHRTSLHRNMQLMASKHFDWLYNLPLRRKLNYEEIYMVHGSPNDPLWEYVTDHKVAVQAIADSPCLITIVGHSHFPLVFFADGTGYNMDDGATVMCAPEDAILFNPGSCGQSRNGDSRACYGIFDDETRTLFHHRVEYDMDSMLNKLIEQKCPDWMVDKMQRTSSRTTPFPGV